MVSPGFRFAHPAGYARYVRNGVTVPFFTLVHSRLMTRWWPDRAR